MTDLDLIYDADGLAAASVKSFARNKYVITRCEVETHSGIPGVYSAMHIRLIRRRVADHRGHMTNKDWKFIIEATATETKK